MTARSSRIRRHIAEFIAEHGPCERCGSDVSLEVFWRDLNVRPMRSMQHLWDLGKPRRDALAHNLIVLCYEHMRTHRTGVDHGGGVHGIKGCTCIPCKDKRREYFRVQMRRHRAQGKES